MHRSSLCSVYWNNSPEFRMQEKYQNGASFNGRVARSKAPILSTLNTLYCLNLEVPMEPSLPHVCIYITQAFPK